MKTVKLYTKNHCPYCESAKRLFKKIEVSFEEINLESKPDERQRLSALAGGYRTMPMIWIGDEFIGGFSEIDSLHSQNKLLSKINS